LFAYPGFRIYDQGELIAEEEVDFFGIGGYSIHRLPHTLDLIEAGTEYDFTVELWTGFYDSLHCTYDLPVIPFQDEICTDLDINLLLFGGATSQFHVTLLNVESEVLVDTLLIDSLGESIAYSIPGCLTESCYELSIVPEGDIDFPVGMSTWLSVPDAFSIIESGGTSAEGDQHAIYSFDVFYGCATSLDELNDDTLEPIALQGNTLVNRSREPLEIVISDLKGAQLDAFVIQAGESKKMSEAWVVIVTWDSQQSGRSGAVKGRVY